MALLRSPDGTWLGEVLRPEDVVNLVCQGYVAVEPEPVAVEPEPATKTKASLSDAVKVDKS